MPKHVCSGQRKTFKTQLSLLPWFLGMRTQVTSLGSQHLDLLSHLTRLSWMFLRNLMFVGLL